MTQPVWITPAGALETVPEGVFYSRPLQATAGAQDVFFRLIAGQLPDGIQITSNGFIEGIPRNIVSVQGVPTEVSADVTSRFAVRAFTRNPNGTVNRLADRTFSITVTGQDVPEFVTPTGNIGTFYDGSEVSIQLLFTDRDPGDVTRVNLIGGSLPPGLVLDPVTGLISGIIAPLVGPPGTATAGYDATPYAEYPFDFTTRSTSTNYQFTLELTDGKDSNVRTFSIYVYSKDSMSADTTDFTADNTFITADVVPTRTPVLLTPAGDLGTVRADNFYAFQFQAIDFDGDPIEYSITTGAGIGYDETLFDETGIGFDRGSFSLPPGLQINPDTGWFYGYIPDQGVTELTYRFAIRVFKKNQPEIISGFYYFTITIIGAVDTDVTWLTAPDLGTINNGAISTLFVEAINSGGRSLQYELASGTNSKLPQGLTLQSSGNITGRVSFNTFALDGNTTTFDIDLNTRLDIDQTTFDLTYDFTVRAFAAQTEQIGYQIGTIRILNGGSGYTSQPSVTISAPPNTADTIQATAGVVTIVGGVITAIDLGNPGRGYLSPPTITISGGGGVGASATATIVESSISNAISVFRTFSLKINRAFNTPYQSLYIKCMPPEADRAYIDQLILNRDIIPVNLVYRADDPNFGIAQNVTYTHAYGLAPDDIEIYVQSLDINHYWKNLTLGQVQVAQALDSNNRVLYEVVYSQIIDDLVNNQGESVNKEVTLPYPINAGDSTEIDKVYPNSLINMRNQVIDTVGQISPALPLWMTSKQRDGRVLGFQPVWVICYAKPGEGDRIAYNIRTQFGENLNIVDYKVDRYEIDRSQTWDWDNDIKKFIPQPPAATTFDTFSVAPSFVTWQNDLNFTVTWQNNSDLTVFWQTPPSGLPQTGTTFDGGATRFITPADRWTDTDEFDKYLVFPRVNILE